MPRLVRVRVRVGVRLRVKLRVRLRLRLRVNLHAAPPALRWQLHTLHRTNVELLEGNA